MIVAIKDRATLLGIHPARVAAYLQSRGWSRLTFEANRYSLWVQPSAAAPVEVLLPLDPNFGDFSERIAELLNDLQREEQRSQIDILRDIDTSACDVFRFLKETHSGFLGAIPIEDGVRFVGYARDMLLYAASAEHEARFLVTGRRSEEVGRFMAQALLGQTEVSSFVVTAQVPIPARLHGELFPEALSPSSEPFERRAGIRLMNLLRMTREAALEVAQTNDVGPFRNVLTEGASFNLFSVLVEAQEIVPGEALEVSAAWAPSRPILETRHSDVVVFEPEIIPPIRSAVEMLRPETPKEGLRVFGFVEVLKQEAEEVLIGDLAIKTIIDGKERKVQTSLQRPEYDQAITAFREKRPVSLVGDLVRVGNRWVLEQPHDLVLYPIPPTGTEEMEQATPREQERLDAKG